MRGERKAPQQAKIVNSPRQRLEYGASLGYQIRFLRKRKNRKIIIIQYYS